MCKTDKRGKDIVQSRKVINKQRWVSRWKNRVRYPWYRASSCEKRERRERTLEGGKGSKVESHGLSLCALLLPNRLKLQVRGVLLPTRSKPVLHGLGSLTVEDLEALPVRLGTVAAEGKDDGGRDRQASKLEACHGRKRDTSERDSFSCTL